MNSYYQVKNAQCFATNACGVVWYGMVWYGMVWYGMVWYGMVWYGMVWYGMVWYGINYCPITPMFYFESIQNQVVENEVTLVEGNVYAVLYEQDDCWYRSVVESIISGDKVNITYGLVDFHFF